MTLIIGENSRCLAVLCNMTPHTRFNLLLPGYAHSCRYVYNRRFKGDQLSQRKRHLCSFPPPPPHPPLIIAFTYVYIYVRIMITTCFITMAVATCTVSIPPLLPTEVVSCAVSLKVAFYVQLVSRPPGTTIISVGPLGGIQQAIEYERYLHI